jgi:hypothetical protein
VRHMYHQHCVQCMHVGSMGWGSQLLLRLAIACRFKGLGAEEMLVFQAIQGSGNQGKVPSQVSGSTGAPAGRQCWPNAATKGSA